MLRDPSTVPVVPVDYPTAKVEAIISTVSPAENDLIAEGYTRTGLLVFPKGIPVSTNDRVFFKLHRLDGFWYGHAYLLKGEATCWRCGAIEFDPEKQLKTHSCGGNFYD